MSGLGGAPRSVVAFVEERLDDREPQGDAGASDQPLAADGRRGHLHVAPGTGGEQHDAAIDSPEPGVVEVARPRRPGRLGGEQAWNERDPGKCLGGRANHAHTLEPLATRDCVSALSGRHSAKQRGYGT